MQKKKIKIKLTGLIWFCIGWIIAFSVSAMWVSGTWNLDRFFDVGQIYDFMEAEYSRYWSPQFDSQGDKLVKNFEEPSERTMEITGNAGKWKWFFIEVDYIDRPEMVWKMQFYQGSSLIQEETVYLKEGLNAFTLAKSRFDRCHIIIEGQKGLTFQINKMQMYEQFPEYNLKMIVVRAGIVFALYMLLSLVWYVVWSNSKYRGMGKWMINRYIGKFQYLFRYTANTLILEHTKKLSVNARSRIRVTLLLFLMFYMNFFDMERMYMAHFPITVAVSALCIFVIAAVSVERRTEILDWRSPICYGWFGLWTVALISEFLVKHQYPGQAPVMLFVFGFLYFVIGNMENPRKMLWDVVYALEILFWFAVVFCVFFRPLRDGIRYSGASYSPAIFSMFLSVEYVTFLGKMEECLKNRESFLKRLFCMTELCVCAFLLWRTQSFTAIVTTTVSSLVFVYRIFLDRRKYRGRILKTLALLVLTAVVSTGVTETVLKKVPVLLDTEMFFEKDYYQEEYFGETKFSIVVHASSNSRFMKKIRNITSPEAMTSGRTLYWLDYIREMNLWGHEDNAVIRANKEKPHNAVVGMAHRYGVFAAIPYTAMLLYCFYYGWKNMMSKKRYANFLPFGYYLTIIVTAMSDNVETSFLWVPWLILYLMFGCAFPERKTERI